MFRDQFECHFSQVSDLLVSLVRHVDVDLVPHACLRACPKASPVIVSAEALDNAGTGSVGPWPCALRPLGPFVSPKGSTGRAGNVVPNTSSIKEKP